MILAVPAAADPTIDALVAAYPNHLTGYDASDLIWKDGTRMPLSDGRSGKTFEQLLSEPDIKDQFAIAYPIGIALRAPAKNEDPGRIRNEAFFRKMYGDCRLGELSKHLRPVRWLGGNTLLATNVNGLADRLAEVSRALEALPASMMRFVAPSAGTYSCRPIAGTERLSMHAYGAAIDLNPKFGDYWLWSRRKNDAIVWKNRMPPSIVETFERHGFIWGGKWYHFDTFHFEYRPEMLALAKQDLRRR